MTEAFSSHVRARSESSPGMAARGWSASAAAWLFPLDAIFKTVGLRYGWLTLLFKRTPPPILAGLGQLRAERAAWRAAKRVPAYRDFLEHVAVDPDDLFPLGILERLPETEKNYIDVYGLMERCVGGQRPVPGHDDRWSSGSTGTPWLDPWPARTRSPIATSRSSRATHSGRVRS